MSTTHTGSRLDAPVVLIERASAARDLFGAAAQASGCVLHFQDVIALLCHRDDRSLEAELEAALGVKLHRRTVEKALGGP